MPDFTVAVLTDLGGAHLDGYFTGLAQTDQVTSVVVSDPSGSSESIAKKLLGSKTDSLRTGSPKGLSRIQARHGGGER